MDTAWLNSWLTDLKLPEYIVTFANAGYTTPEQCATIRDRDALKHIGVSKLGHLTRLIRAIEKLGSEINGREVGGGGDSSTLPLSNSVHDGDVVGGRSVALHQSKSATMTPMSGEGVVKNPPPIPKRKSVRRATTSPINPAQSPTPSPSPDRPSDLAPPPVLPRQQSLKIHSLDRKKPPVATRRGTRSNTGGEEPKPSTLLTSMPEMSPGSSPLTPTERDLPVSTTASTTAEINGPSSSATLPTGLSSSSSQPMAPSRLTPLPKPRPKPRQHSPDPAVARRGLMADVNNRGDGELGVVGGGAVSNGLETIPPRIDSPNVENSLPEAPLEVTSPPPPPIPVKKTVGGKRIIIPDEDVVFELEDVPMPETPQLTSHLGKEALESAPYLRESREPPPSLPVKEKEVSSSHPSVSVVPVLPPKEEASTSTSSIPALPLKDTHGPSQPSSIPALLPKEMDIHSSASMVPDVPLDESEVTAPAVPSKDDKHPSVVPTEHLNLHSEFSTTPSPPTRRHFVGEVEPTISKKTPPLPRRDTGPPNFSPPPPPPELEEGEGEVQFPLLPPPRTATLPPSAQKIGNEREIEGGRLSPPPQLASMPESTAVGLPQDTPVGTAQEEPSSVPSHHHIQSVWNDDDDIIPVTGLESLAPPTNSNDDRSGNAATDGGTYSGSETSPEHDLSASLGGTELRVPRVPSGPPPVLPPKEHQQQPPPPPPITPDDYPEDYSTSDMSDSDEESRPRMSIQSSRDQQDDDRMMVAHAPSSNGGALYSDDDSYNTTPSSSAESTPKKKTLIRQSGSSLQRGFTDDDIMVVSPQPPVDSEDYMNQEAIDTVTQDTQSGPSLQRGFSDDNIMIISPKPVMQSEDYMNQEAIDTVTQDTQSGPSLQRGFSDDNIMIVSPKPVMQSEDYMNQEAIDKATHDTDYMNQDAIDQSLADEDDVNATNVKREHFVIRGSSPIKSRTLELTRTDKDRDYENQNVVDEVLEGDIIPVGTIPSPEVPISQPTPAPTPVTRRDYAYSMPPPVAQQRVKRHKYEEMDPIPQTRSNTVSFDEKKLIFRGREEESGPTSLSILDDSSTNLSAQAQKGDSVPEEDIEIESALEASGGSINQTFPRTMSAASSQHKPPLPRHVPQEPSSTSEVTKQRSHSVEEIDVGIISASAPKQQRGYYDHSQLPRAAGTFAGIDSGYKRPNFSRFQSDDPLARRDGRGFMESAVLYPGYTRKDSADLAHVPKTKEGFLYKKGGVHGDKPWQRRWVTFNGTELKYFKNQSDKDKSSRNIIPLAEMIDIKKVPDDDKMNRFDLVVINRVFQFSADSLEDSQVWINVLHAAISRFKPQEVKEGGNMSDPDRQGFLLKQGHGPFAKFKERYVALKGSKFAYYVSKEDFVHGRPIHILEMTLSSVRPDMAAKLPRFLITMNNQKQYVFQAADELERKEWMDVLTSAILTGLDTREQTLARAVKQTKSTEILQQIQENPSNKRCADCAATDPVWGVINLGIMVCINCSGVHRSMGTHISKVRSVELDHQIWKPTLIQLMNMIGNERSNSFWERHSQRRERLPADVERDIRENFIRAKYQVKSWIPTPTGESKEALNKLLQVAVKTDNLMRTVELLTLGADICHVISDSVEPDVTCVLEIAKKYDRVLQVELLEQNGALVCRRPQEPAASISKKGFLYKTGSDRAGWKRRYCSLDKFRGFQYYKTETDTDLLGHIHMEEMMSVARCEDELSKDPKYQHCFEVNTQGRGYLFCADSEAEMDEWIKVFGQIINTSDAAENLGYDKVGYLKKKDPHNVGGWKRRWFTLKGKSLAYYKREREEVDEIDLRKVTDLKGPDMSGTYEQQCCIQIVVLDRTYQLRAENPAEAESWMSALRHTQVSGIPLSKQQLTSTGIPILIHKCLQFVESYGMETEGLYRLSGEKAKIRKLILAFNQDARGVVIDPEVYTVHDVTGTLKLFFRSLPDPLLTHQLYHSFIATMQTDHESLLYQLQSLIEQLPPVNKDTLKRMVGHLRKVADYEAKNKMGVSNLVSLFGTTLMTVDGDPITFANTQFECNCISTMIKYYKWLFQVDEEEEKKEEAIEKGLQRIKEAEQMQQRIASISSNLGFLTTIYIGSKEGDSFNTNITGQTTVAQVVEDVATRKALPKTNYALYLVLGDSESHRVLSFSEKLLAAQCSAGTDCFLCLKPNTFADTLGQYFNTLGEGMPVVVHVREKKKWRKYPCTVRNSCFIQFKDAKCHNEFFKVAVNDLDIFAGIERNKIDVKNPMPTRYCFWLKTMRGEENCKFLCADSEADMLKLMAAIVQAKYPDRLQTPLLPVRPPPEQLTPPLGNDRRLSPEEEKRDSSVYANVKLSGRTR